MKKTDWAGGTRGSAFVNAFGAARSWKATLMGCSAAFGESSPPRTRIALRRDCTMNSLRSASESAAHVMSGFRERP
jgi:hypothetical protein